MYYLKIIKKPGVKGPDGKYRFKSSRIPIDKKTFDLLYNSMFMWWSPGLSKDIGNNRFSKFTLEVTNSKTSLSFEDFATIINDMVVTIEDIANKGWTLTDFFASPDDDSAGEHRFYHIRFVFTKPKEVISNKTLQSAFTKEQITDVFNSDGLDVDGITFYDEYIEVEFTSRNYNDDDIDDRLDSITKRLGGREYENNYDTVKIWFDQE
jgi:hypothetical protein